jgi:HlyD family secretion protein
MKKLLVLLVLVAAVFVGGAFWLNHARTATGVDEGFTFAAAEFGSLTESVSATGLLQPAQMIAVGSELSGRVVEVYPEADVNQVVEEGMPLLRLDDEPARIKLQQAQTAVQLARADLEKARAAKDAAELKAKRLRQLDPDVGLRKELDEAEALARAARATVTSAETKIQEAQEAEKAARYGLELTIVRARIGPEGKATFTSPARRFTVLERKVVLGQMIAPPVSAQLFTLASDLGEMQVHVQVSENDIAKMRKDLQASFTVYAYSEEDVRFRGKVVEIRPMPANVHGAVFYDTVVDVANRRDPKTNEWMLRPGMTANVDIILREHARVWKVPTAALGFQLDERSQSEAARNRLAEWQSKTNAQDWKPVWILDAQGRPWPVFLRTGGKNAAGEPGITDGQYVEVLEWDPELQPKPDPKAASAHPRFITGAPPAARKGLFDRANVRVF